MKRSGLILALLLAVIWALLWEGDPLTSAERAWVNRHGVIKVGAGPDYPPVDFTDLEGKSQGVSVDYWRLLASRMKIEVEFYPIEFSRQLEGIKSGEFDTLTGFFPLAERVEHFDFSQSYMNINAYIFVRPQYAKVTGMKDLKGLKIGVVEGDSGQTYCRNAGYEPLIFSNYTNTILALARRDIDAIVMDELVVVYIRKKYKIEDKIVRVGQPVDHGRMVIPVKKGNKILLSVLNKGVAAISRKELREISIKWLQ